MDAPRSLPHPGVRFPPPLLFAVAFLLGWALETRVYRMRVAETDTWQSMLTGVGIFLLLGGLATIAWGMLTFSRSRTAIIPYRPASQLVVSGPYRYTRNPMYVGLTAAYVGGAFLANVGWPLIFLPLAMLSLYHLVIRREESYLAQAFGQDYESYRQRVRRWL